MDHASPTPLCKVILSKTVLEEIHPIISSYCFNYCAIGKLIYEKVMTVILTWLIAGLA